MTSPRFEESTARRLDAAIAHAIAQDRIVGTVVVVAQGGQVVHRRAAGFADRAAARPMREDAIFLWSSVTKAVTTLAALRLVEEGRLALHEPVARLLPGFRPRLADGRAADITLHQLLTHTAGLAYPGNRDVGAAYREAGVSSGLDATCTSLAENLRRVATLPLVHAPGRAWMYSLALDVVGALVEAATALPLARAVEVLVCAPLGMRDAGFAVADRARLVTHYADGVPGAADPRPQPMAAVHRATHEGTRFEYALDRIFLPPDVAYPSAGGGMAGTADDALRALEAIRGGAPGVLDAAAAARTRHAHVGAQAATQGPGWGFGYGGALLVDPRAAGSRLSAGTLAWGGVYGHTWFVDPVRELTVVALTNTALEGLFGRFPAQVVEAVLAD